MGTAGRNGKGLRMSLEWESGAKHSFPLPFPFSFPPGRSAECRLAMEALNLAQFALARASAAVKDAMRVSEP
jgi:hypothetical protein